MYCAVAMRAPDPGPFQTSAAARFRRRAAAAAVAVAVLLLHGLAFRALIGIGGHEADGVRAPALPVSVRALAADARDAEPTAAPPTPIAPRPAPADAVPAVAVPASAPEVPPPAPQVAVAAPGAADVPAPASAAGEAAGEGTSAPATDPGGEAVPVYPTRLPPAARLAYVLRRGLLSGQAQLDWRPDADGAYTLALDGGAFGQSLLAQRSVGHVDAHGLAPDRFTDRRRGRQELATNFQRDAGTITFSGPTVSYPLVPGAQDRASWMVQLGAIVAADPARQAEGAEIRLFVVGARGDADVWSFVVEGRETVQTPAGAVPDALRLRRLPRRAYDTEAQAWLDPARGHLPVRVRLAVPDSGDETELLLARD